MAYTTSGGLADEVDIAGLDAATVQLLIDEATSVVDNFCGRTFGSHNQVDYFDGDRSSTVLLSRGPALVLSSLVVNGATLNATDYILRGRMIRLKTGHFHHGIANVVATYTWGESTVPPAVGRATRLLARNFVLARKQLEWEKQADADLSVSNFDGFTPGAYVPRRTDNNTTGDDTVDALLQSYRKPDVGFV